MKFVKQLDAFLNTIPMYRLVLYSLRTFVGLGIMLSFFGIINYSWTGMLASLAILVGVCYTTNKFLAYLYKAPAMSESTIITALILTCILPQATSLHKALYIGLAGLLAITTKYLITWRYKHIFNPAAMGIGILSVASLFYPSWWIGIPELLPAVAVAGFLIVRKIHRSALVGSFLGTSLLVGALVAIAHGHAATNIINTMIISGPLIFFATIMLTEPSTTPSRRYYQILYGIVVGALFAAQLSVGSVSLSPQLALLIGNLFAYGVSFRQRVWMTLEKKIRITDQLYDFVFIPSRQFQFMAGQYMEWTLPHHRIDRRGSRRAFSIASSPTEPRVHLGIKFYEPSSTFKLKLQNMKPGDTLISGALAGDFCLPVNRTTPLIWIAGGIGITPFRSMLQYLHDTKQSRHITLFYVVKTKDEIAYSSVLSQAQADGITVTYIYSDMDVTLTPELIRGAVDNKPSTALYYIAGPDGMVQHYKRILRKEVGVPRRQIITDYFSGY